MLIDATDKEIQMIGRSRRKVKGFERTWPGLIIMVATIFTYIIINLLKLTDIYNLIIFIYFIPTLLWINYDANKDAAIGKVFLEQIKAGK